MVDTTPGQSNLNNEPKNKLTVIDAFIDSLKPTPNGDLFNPWFERDLKHDRTPEAPDIRRRQFRAYLQERAGSAKFLFIAEALGYQGGHFTGIAMTSERILLGHQQENYGVRPDHVFQGLEPVRTSRPEVNRNGMSEPTATIMWGVLTELGINPYEIVLWNALPWHPFNPESPKGMLSNRTPTRRELKSGLERLSGFMELFPDAKPIAVGRKCEESLKSLGLDPVQVRHPANGGAPKFRSQVRKLFSNLNQ
ncbi:MAG: uracil-DNA glycosylase [Balneolaceae bacterium]